MSTCWRGVNALTLPKKIHLQYLQHLLFNRVLLFFVIPSFRTAGRSTVDLEPILMFGLFGALNSDGMVVVAGLLSED